MKSSRFPRRFTIVFVLAFLAIQAVAAKPAWALPGDTVADVITPEGATFWPLGVSPSVAFDGKYLYYADYMGHVLHRIDTPPAGGTYNANNHIDIGIVGLPSGIMALAYDAGRDAFWVTGGDGLSVYLLAKTGVAILEFTIDPVNGRPGYACNPGDTCQESKLGYDRSDDTLWIGPDASTLIFHYQTYPDPMGHAVLATNPSINVSIPPNDMAPECGYSIVSAIAVGGDHLFLGAGGCARYFEYTKAGVKVSSVRTAAMSVGDFECDNVTYPVSVIWVKNSFWGEIRAYEQPAANACRYGG
jgi:hypothetical protein